VQLASPQFYLVTGADDKGVTSEMMDLSGDEFGRSDESDAIGRLCATRQQACLLHDAVVMLRQSALGLETPVGTPCGVMSPVGHDTRHAGFVETAKMLESECELACAKMSQA
jgi:hypothetical protein